MQIVSTGANLHEMSDPGDNSVFWEKKNISKCHLLKVFTQSAKALRADNAFYNSCLEPGKNPRILLK